MPDPYRTEEAAEPIAAPDLSQYWANSPKDRIATEILDRVQQHHDRMERTGRYWRMRKSYRLYYGEADDGSSTSHGQRFGGEQGEIVLTKANIYRALARQQHVMITKNRPAWKPRATNLDYESQAQVTIAEGVLEHYMTEKRFERIYDDCAECSIVMSEGFVRQRWDTAAGNAYGVDPESGMQVNEGDIIADMLMPFDVVKDRRRSFDRTDWVICRDFRNKYDLAVRYPEYGDKLTKLTGDDAWKYTVLGDPDEEETSDIPVYEFYHRPTDAVPQGRLVVCASAECVLFDGPLPYERIPVLRMAPSTMIGTSHGYTDLYDCIGPQELFDALLSSLASNVDAHGVQNVMIGDTTQISPRALPGGGNLWKISPGDVEPKGVNLTKMPEDWQPYGELLQKLAKQQLGLNDVVMGDPGANIKSGAMAALFVQQALEFMSGLEASRTRLLEDGGSLTVEICKRYAKTPRIAEIAGKDKQYMMQEWSAQSLTNVHRVVVDSGNAMERTVAGKLTLADKLLEVRGDSDLFAKYVEVLTTGKLDPILNRPRRQQMLIQRENEMLARGEMPPVSLTDLQPDHILGHAEVLDSPEARADEMIMNGVNAHISEHLAAWAAMGPVLAAALGVPPFPGDPAMAGGAMPPGPTPANDNGAAAGEVVEAPVSENAEPPRQPEAAQDPLGRGANGAEEAAA